MLSEQTRFKEDLTAIKAEQLGKCYKIYDNPKHRLKQALFRGRKQYFREFWALKNISFEIKKGESIGIVGRNGSGKSTLLQIICGTLMQSEGTIKTNGKIAALLELGSGFNPEFSGIENIYLNASLYGLSHKETSKKLDDIRKFADIGDFVHQPIKTYSSGMTVRLAFAVIAHVEPKILIIDEALSVGDAVFTQRCMKFIRRFKEQGTLIFVSHDLNSIASLCERSMWINSGKLIIDGDNKDVVKAYTRHCQESTNDIKNMSDEKRADASINGQIQLGAEDITKSPEIKKKDIVRELDKSLSGYSQNIITASNVADWERDKDYGNGNAIIKQVSILDSIGEKTLSPCSGDNVTLRIDAHAIRTIENFMAGFIFRDKTGMLVWGENNIASENVYVEEGRDVRIEFEFRMPILRAGSYAISAAVSEGSVDIPEAMHYKPDVIALEPFSGNRIVHGVFTVPDIKVTSKISQ